MAECSQCRHRVGTEMRCPKCDAPIVSNKKIQIERSNGGWTLDWAPMPGFSLLFDPPTLDVDEIIEPPRKPWSKIVQVPFYQQLWVSLKQLDGGLKELSSTYSFYALPIETYHVTFVDGVNYLNIDKVCIPDPGCIAAFLGRLPDDQVPNSLPECMRPLLKPIPCDAVFQFSKLTMFGGKELLAAQLDLNKEESARDINTIRKGYKSKMFGVGRMGKWHVTLGYFANEKGGCRARKKRREWSDAFCKEINDTKIEFNSVSLYGFTDMASYYRLTGTDG